MNEAKIVKLPHLNHFQLYYVYSAYKLSYIDQYVQYTKIPWSYTSDLVILIQGSILYTNTQKDYLAAAFKYMQILESLSPILTVENSIMCKGLPQQCVQYCWWYIDK